MLLRCAGTVCWDNAYALKYTAVRPEPAINSLVLAAAFGSATNRTEPAITFVRGAREPLSLFADEVSCTA